MDVRHAANPLRWIAIGSLGLAFLWSQQLPFEPPHDSGQSITGAFEGWFPNSDGSFSILLGYYNRNLKQEVDIPAAPITGSSPADPTRASRRISYPVVNGVSSPSACP